MILADTSLWIEHLRRGHAGLAAALENEEVLVHPFVIGELACGNIANRSEILELLARLPVATKATDREVLHFIEVRRLMGRGLGYIDMHLLASTALTGTARLWTRDRALADAAEELDLSHDSGR